MDHTIQNKIYSFTVTYEEAPEGGYVGFAPALPGCHTQGGTLEETEENLKEAIQVYLESMIAHKEKIPSEKRILQGKVEVKV